jgi:hypothetical protein
LEDNWHDLVPGHSFIDNPNNEHILSGWDTWLKQNTESQPVIRCLLRLRPQDGIWNDAASPFVPDSVSRGAQDSSKAAELGWNALGIQQYLLRLETFLHDFHVLGHLTARLPARAPELMTICF